MKKTIDEHNRIEDLLNQYRVLVPIRGNEREFKTEYTFRTKKHTWVKTDRYWLGPGGRRVDFV